MSEREDQFRKELEHIYDNGDAILQYAIEGDNFKARYRDKTYYVNDFYALKEMAHVVVFKTPGLIGTYGAPIADILSLPNTVEI